MNLPSLRLALVASLVLPLGLATASLAQDAPPPAGADMHHQHHFDPASMRQHMAGRLRAELQLTPGQEPALNALLDAMKPAGDMPRDMQEGMRHEHGDMQALTTPQRLDKMLARADEMHAHMVAHVAAVKQFYVQLTPGQQKAFDAMHMGHGMGGMHGHGGWDRHGGGMGDHGMGPGGPPQG